MSNIKVAVLGSCVSRDSFNSNFIKNYKAFYRCVFDQNHTSMISLMSKPIPFTANKLGKLTDFNKQILMNELVKGFWQTIHIHKPDYLILDFYADVYFGIRKTNDSSITDRWWLFQDAPLYSSLELGERLNLNNNFDEYLCLWKQSVDAFMKKMCTDFPDIKVVINKIYFTDFYYSGEGEDKQLKKISESGKYRKLNVDQINTWLDIFYQYFEDNYDVSFLNYDKTYYSVEDHYWDYFYVHYTNDFYEDFTIKLLSLLLSDYSNMRNQIQNKIGYKSENLIRNGSFNEGKAFWTFWHNDFIIEQPQEDAPGSSILTICHRDSEKDLHRQIWSHAVEINTDGKQEYKLSFEIKIKDIEEIDSLKSIFALRTFNKIDLVFQSESQWFKNFKVWEIEEIKNNEWTKCSFVVKPTAGKYLKIGPYLMRNGEVSWRNISLEKLY